MNETKIAEFNGTKKLRPYYQIGVWVQTNDKLLKAFDVIMDNISYKIAETAPTKLEDPKILLDYLNATYGERNLMDAEEKFEKYLMNGIDPNQFISDLEILEGRVELAGGTNLPKQWFKVLTKNINCEFYQDFYRAALKDYGTGEFKYYGGGKQLLRL